MISHRLSCLRVFHPIPRYAKLTAQKYAETIHGRLTSMVEKMEADPPERKFFLRLIKDIGVFCASCGTKTCGAD